MGMGAGLFEPTGGLSGASRWLWRPIGYLTKGAETRDHAIRSPLRFLSSSETVNSLPAKSSMPSPRFSRRRASARAP